MRRLALLGLIALALLACGKKGPPVAPERRIPATVSGLSATVEGRAIHLEWSNPSSRADGSRMKDLTALRVYRREEAGHGEPKPAMLSWGKVVGYDEIATIRMAEPAPAQVESGRVKWTDSQGLRFGQRYVYVVIAADSIGRSSGPSERQVVTFHAAPLAPQNLRVVPGEREARLTWSPPAGLVDGGTLPPGVTYQLLRSESQGGPFHPVTTTPINSTAFTDSGLRNEQTYSYAVRAVRSEATGSARSEPSTIVAATPVDLTPPSPPKNLVAVPSEAAIRLAWDPSPEDDVAGYLVYRSGPTGSEAVRLTPTPIPNTIYTDRNVTRAATYRYIVTAVDRAARPNESARSNEVTATVP
jgi:hypothetical protein